MVMLVQVLTISSVIGLAIFLLLYFHNPTSILNGFIFDCELGLLLMTAGFAIVLNPHLRVLSTIFILLLFAVALIIVLGGIWIVIAFLLINAVRVFRKEQHKLQNMLSLIIGLGLLVQTIIFFTARGLLRQPLVQIIMGFLLIVEGWLLITAICFITSSLLCRLDRPRKNTDYIIILGAGLLRGNEVSPLLKARIDVAIHFYQKVMKKGKHTKLLFSGGQGKDETVSEAEAMRDYAMGQGIPEQDILIENKSTTTLENFKFSKAVMDADANGSSYRCGYATSNYHVFRSRIYAQKAGLPKAKGLGAKTARYYMTNATIREYIAVMLNNKKSSFIQLAFIAVSYFAVVICINI
ncbi:MAG: YdcF family protein [bacterium]|nr:YdcF family protein [bacterium]